MRPITELVERPSLLLFDVDDTVTREGYLEPVALAALASLREAGLRTAAVTGRPLGWAEVFAWTWPVDLAIGENGAGWMWREGRRLVRRYFEPAAARAAHREALDALVAALGRSLPSLPLAGDAPLRVCDAAWDVGELWRAPEALVLEATDAIEASGMRALRSSVHLHAVPGAWDKASGALRAIEERFARPGDELAARTVFVGDSGNDAAAFARFALSVGVANVREHLSSLPTPPRYVTEAPRGRGFAELAERLLALGVRDG